MQLRLDAADRLVELVEEQRGPVAVDVAARTVLKLGQAVPVGLARSLLDEAVRDIARGRMEHGIELATQAGFQAEGRLEEGKPGRMICRVADAAGAGAGAGPPR